MASAANAQTITDVLRRDQKGQGKVVINQSADIERLVNNRQPQTTTTTTPNVKPTENQNNKQQKTKTATNKQAKPTTSQQGVKSNLSKEKNNTTPHQTEQRQTNNANQSQTEQRQNEQHTTEQRQNGNVNERSLERQNNTVTERSIERQTTRTTTARPSPSYNYDSDAPAVNTNKKIMRHSYKTTGYRIQVYVGGNKRADRTKCEQIAARLKTVFPDEPIYVHFYSPSWKCRMGNFTSLDEAKIALKQVRKMGYNQACVVKGTINVQY